MRHLKKGRKLNRTSSHKKALMRNLATALITHKKIHTTLAKAKELRPYIEKLITRAKKSYIKEQNNLLPEGAKLDIHSRRIASAYVYGKAAVQALFDEIAPKVTERPGGYTRIIKTGIRQGDSATTAVIQLVDWFDIQDGAISKKRRKKVTKSKPKTTTDKPAEKPIEQQSLPSSQPPQETPEVSDSQVRNEDTAATTENNPIDETEHSSIPSSESSSNPDDQSAEPVTNASEEIQPSDEIEEVKVKKSEE